MTYANAVIVPHYNDARRLRRCLDVLARSRTPETEIIVVDNNSTVDLSQVMADFPDIRFVTEFQSGAAHARNRGVRETTAPNLFFIDCDCIPADDWLATASRICGTAPVIGGAIDVFDETTGPRNGAQAFETVFAFNYRDYILNKGFSVTANLLTTRAVFSDVGGFVHGLSEDAEWCFRARGKGYPISLAEELRVSHPTRGDWAELKRKWRRIAREMHELSRNGAAGSWRAKWVLRAVAMAGSIPVHLPKVLFSTRLAGTGERLRGAATLVRLRLLRSFWMMRQAAGLPI